MTPEELVDDMANRAEFDDAYINETAKRFADLDMEGMKRFMTCFNEKQSKFTDGQKANIQKINFNLAKTTDFATALQKWHAWKQAETAKAESGQ